MKIDTITNTYKEHNEDVYGHTERCFWLLDGALSLNKAKFTNGYSDVVWMVNWWNRYIAENIEQFDRSIVSILEEGVDLLNSEFDKFIKSSGLSKLDRSTAAIVIVRINETAIECFGLGDCEINVRLKNGKIDLLTDHSIMDMDNRVIDMIFNTPGREVVFNGYTAEELRILRENRSRINEPEGYYILEHDREAVKHGHYTEYRFEDVKDFILMSDGFAAIYNKYDQVTIEELLDSCQKYGVEPIVNTIRELEEGDRDFNKFKRLREHDDATALYVNLH